MKWLGLKFEHFCPHSSSAIKNERRYIASSQYTLMTS